MLTSVLNERTVEKHNDHKQVGGWRTGMGTHVSIFASFVFASVITKYMHAQTHTHTYKHTQELVTHKKTSISTGCYCRCHFKMAPVYTIIFNCRQDIECAHTLTAIMPSRSFISRRFSIILPHAKFELSDVWGTSCLTELINLPH